MRATSAASPLAASAATASACQEQDPAFVTCTGPGRRFAPGRAGLGEVGRVGGREDLVGDDAQGLPARARARIRSTKEPPFWRLPPRRRRRSCARPGVGPARRDEGLAGELGGAVDAERPRRVVLAVRPRGGAVEDVVGRDVHQERARLARRAGEKVRGRGVDGERGPRLRLGRVHAVAGGGVEDHVRPHLRHSARTASAVGDVELGAVAGPGEIAPSRATRSRPSCPTDPATSALSPIASASAKSRPVSPPASWVVRVRVTFGSG